MKAYLHTERCGQSISSICGFFGYTRQAYYKGEKSAGIKEVKETLILDNVRAFRHLQPKVGTRKLQMMLKEFGFDIGRDALFNLLRSNDMLIKPTKKYARTTNSKHRFRKYSNLIEELEISEPNQVFVADITYISTLEGFCYLSLITDYASRKIVGYDLSRSLAIEGAQRALRMALEDVKHPEKLIHHSDRGIQYCSNGYTQILQKHKVKISMTEENHCYENAVAERVNGILKTEFLLGEKLQSFEVAKELVKQSINTYNQHRLHTSISFLTPETRYRMAA